jgi:hypothetical protein
MKTFLATCSLLLLSAGSALAQDDGTTDGSMDSSTDGSMDTSGGGGGTDTGGGMDTGGGGGGSDPTMGIETELNGAADSPALHLLYNLGGNYLDAVVALAINNTSPDGGDSTTAFVIGIGAGYRMYKDMDGRIHPYLEPYLSFAIANDNDDTTVNTIDIGAGAMLGVDFMLFDQFTVGAALGGGLDFEIDSDPAKANILSIGVYTTSVNATFWWG